MGGFDLRPVLFIAILFGAIGGVLGAKGCAYVVRHAHVEWRP